MKPKTLDFNKKIQILRSPEDIASFAVCTHFIQAEKKLTPEEISYMENVFKQSHQVVRESHKPHVIPVPPSIEEFDTILSKYKFTRPYEYIRYLQDRIR